ncbi:hypothetical protein B0H19DRAFT_1253264 [Mycena capillaripes]|nr:hypothetical protein B0H19DRAFT_1253264 [Mycena capillaripes]
MVLSLLTSLFVDENTVNDFAPYMAPSPALLVPGVVSWTLWGPSSVQSLATTKLPSPKTMKWCRPATGVNTIQAKNVE